MIFQLSYHTKSFVTQKTFVSAFSFMDTLDVGFDIASTSKNFIAQRTFEAFTFMDRRDVGSEMANPSEFLTTQSTFVGVAFLLFMFTDVDFEIESCKKLATLRTFELFKAVDFVQAQIQGCIHELAAALALLGSNICILYPIRLNFFCLNLSRHFSLHFFHFFLFKIN